MTSGTSQQLTHSAAMLSLTPYLCVRDAAAAITWYATAFGAREVVRFTDADGKVGHAELEIAGWRIFLADEYPELGVRSPLHSASTPVSFVLVADDVDALFTRATAAGATVRKSLAVQFDGRRGGTVIDPFGHRWMLSSPETVLPAAELEARMGGAFRVTDGGR